MVKSNRLKKTLRIIGTLLMVLSFFFIGRVIWKNWDVLVGSFSWKCVLYIFIFAVCNTILFIVYGILFRKLLCSISGKSIEKEKAVAYYVTANLYKYIPGNVMHYVGRNRLATEGYVGFEDVNISSALEILCNVIAAAIVSGCLASGYANKYIKEFVNTKTYFAIGIAAITIFVIAIVFFRKKIGIIIKRCLKKEVFISVIMIVFANIFWNVVSGLTVISFFNVLGGYQLSNASILNIIGCNTVCWLVGFVVIGAPGGIGIREALMNILLSTFVEGWIISATGVMMRIGQIIGEIIATTLTNIIKIKVKS